MAARKVVSFLPPEEHSDDAHRFAMNLARGLVESSGGGYEVELVSVASEPGTWSVASGVTVRRLSVSGRPRDARNAVSWEIPQAFAGADLVHLHQAHTRGAEVGLLVAKLQRKPVCVTDHAAAASPLVRQLGAFELVDRVIASSDFSATLCRTSAPVTVVKGGVDTTWFTPPETPAPRDRFLYVGPLLPRYGIDRLIAAIPAGLPLTVCGRVAHDDYGSRLVSLAAGKAVEFITDADDARVLALYRRAWAAVLPSVQVDCDGSCHDASEALGLPLMESLACGTPVVASRLGALPEFVREGETGFLFDEAAELTGLLDRLATEPGLAETMGRQGRLAAVREFDYRLAGATLLDVFEGLIGSAAASSEMAA